VYPDVRVPSYFTGVGLILLILSRQINDIEADFLRAKFKKLFQTAQNTRLHEQNLKRKLANIENEILEEKIAIEKTLIDETEETRHLQMTGEVRSSLQIQLESTEQRDTIAQFELMELKKVHEELTVALSSMKTQNSELVDPTLERLRKEVRSICRWCVPVTF
jgi:septal ring factor EnvC (AmiA/AmiB activator)